VPSLAKDSGKEPCVSGSNFQCGGNWLYMRLSIAISFALFRIVLKEDFVGLEYIMSISDGASQFV
jgi:hypothetical protein